MLRRFLKKHGLKKGVELGVLRGDTFFYLLRHMPDLELTGIDLWQPTGQGNDRETGERDYSKFPLDAYYRQILSDTNKFPGRAWIYRGDTAKAAHLFEDDELDFVFLDADHTFEGVSRDILAWKSKAEWLIGHDVDFPSVKKAIDALLPGWEHIGEKCWAARTG